MLVCVPSRSRRSCHHRCRLSPFACASQVRNLRSSIKVALDFVSPDAVHECLELRGEFRCGL